MAYSMAVCYGLSAKPFLCRYLDVYLVYYV